MVGVALECVKNPLQQSYLILLRENSLSLGLTVSWDIDSPAIRLGVTTSVLLVRPLHSDWNYTTGGLQLADGRL